MGIGEVIEQKNGGALATTAASAAEATNTSSAGTANSPTIKMSVNNREYTFGTQTLILYGVVLADILLLYIALGG